MLENRIPIFVNERGAPPSVDTMFQLISNNHNYKTGARRYAQSCKREYEYDQFDFDLDLDEIGYIQTEDTFIPEELQDFLNRMTDT